MDEASAMIARAPRQEFSGRPVARRVLIPCPKAVVWTILGTSRRIHSTQSRNEGLPDFLPTISDLLNTSILKDLDFNNPLHGNREVNNQAFTYSNQKNHIVINDEQGKIEYTVENGKKYLKAFDPAGKIIFEGPLNTPKQREKLPNNVLKKLYKIESYN